MRLVTEKTNHTSELLRLTPSEQVRACCIIAREHIETGDYDSASMALQPWWTIGEWPSHRTLTDSAAAELFFTAGVLSGSIGSARQIQGGQKPAEALLNGSITLFERLGGEKRA